MKLLVVLLSLVALCAGSAIPLPPQDNSHYVEGQSRYVWMPDGAGKPVLVDLEAEPTEDELDALTRNGADNQYWLFTRQNPGSRQVLVNGNLNSVRNSNYRNRATVVVVHGWNQNGGAGMNNQIRDAFLAIRDCNVIVVDWNRLANTAYNNAARGVPDVGRHIGNFINWVFNNFGGNWGQLHLVGFSLGAHVVGNAGRQVGGRASRVTGLDPAGPTWGGNRDALNRNSGVYVEVIHTNGGALGIRDVIGDSDFYPNGGRNQPGCSMAQPSCSHGRAPEFFASSVRTNHFIGRRCVNLSEADLNTCNGAQFRMGNGDLGKRGSGIYGLRTGASWPF